MSEQLPGASKAIRLYCLECTCQQTVEVRECPAVQCPVFKYRQGPSHPASGSRLRAIKAKCYECSGHNRKDADECTLADCPLHPYRFGKNPSRAKTPPSDAQIAARKAAGDRLRKYPDSAKNTIAERTCGEGESTDALSGISASPGIRLAI